MWILYSKGEVSFLTRDCHCMSTRQNNREAQRKGEELVIWRTMRVYYRMNRYLYDSISTINIRGRERHAPFVQSGAYNI